MAAVAKSGPAARVVFCVHTVDGPRLRGADAVEAICELRSPQTHLLASCDHINVDSCVSTLRKRRHYSRRTNHCLPQAPLLWTSALQNRANWLVQDGTSFAWYDAEARGLRGSVSPTRVEETNLGGQPQPLRDGIVF